MKRLRHTLLLRTVVATGVIAMTTNAAFAQPADAPAGDLRDQPPTPERMRFFITRQLERSNEQQEHLHHALDMLDEGAPLDEVETYLRANIAGGRERNAQKHIDRDEILETLKELNPRLHKRLLELKNRNPRRFELQLTRLVPRVAPMARLRKEDPDKWHIRAQLFQSEQKVRPLARRAASALTDEERQAAIKQLSGVINQQFDLREQMHEIELARVEERIAEGRSKLDDARAHRNELVAKRVREVVENAAKDELLGGELPAQNDRPRPNRE